VNNEDLLLDELTLTAQPLSRAVAADDTLREPKVQTLTCTGKGCPRNGDPVPSQLAVRYAVIEQDRRKQFRFAGREILCPECAARMWSES